MNRKILAFDVGIRNLAWCLIQTTYKTPQVTSELSLLDTTNERINNPITISEVGWDILDWGMWDLRMDRGDEKSHPETCNYKSRKGSSCTKTPIYNEIHNGKIKGGVCGIHCKKLSVKLVKDDIDKMKRMSVKELKEYASKLIPEYSIQGKLKKEIQNDCFKFLNDNCLQPIPKLKKAKQVTLSDIHKRLLQRLSDLPMDLDLVVIENQPVNLNALMKSIQIILWTSIRMNMIRHGNQNPQVEFMNASRKLMIVPDDTSYCLYRIQTDSSREIPSIPKSTQTIKELEPEPEYDIINENEIVECTVSIKDVKNLRIKKKEQKQLIKKQKYLQRKMTAVDISNQLLKKMNMTYYEWFQKQSKKDDLADSLLMTLYCALDRKWL
jgi:hypothetical protein